MISIETYRLMNFKLCMMMLLILFSNMIDEAGLLSTAESRTSIPRNTLMKTSENSVFGSTSKLSKISQTKSITTS